MGNIIELEGKSCQRYVRVIKGHKIVVVVFHRLLIFDPSFILNPKKIYICRNKREEEEAISREKNVSLIFYIHNRPIILVDGVFLSLFLIRTIVLFLTCKKMIYHVEK